ncbi:hypothetical protein scyTo_0011078 [Scyliorhinus torazame]|uniref:C2H2-type domain-containing protein n=1 Tax=Scyliorhinus torazame TaxID=75743 RepID=A0A401NGV8_SCYTO|nr:hypothetical protein [Scyliorhinus torazame]
MTCRPTGSHSLTKTKPSSLRKVGSRKKRLSGRRGHHSSFRSSLEDRTVALQIISNTHGGAAVICKVACVSALNLQEHIRGYQHRKVEQILKETLGNKVDTPTASEMNSGCDTRTFDDYLLSWNASEPLIGLNYVIEYQRDGGRDPMYECTLCDFTGYLRIFVSHLGGIKHRMNYMVIRGQDPPSTIGVVKRVPLPNTPGQVANTPQPLLPQYNSDIRGNPGGSMQEGMNSQSNARHSYQEYGSKGWQQEWGRNSSKLEQDLMEGIMNTREQPLTSGMMYSAPRNEEGQYRADNRSTDVYSDWRKDGKDQYEESAGDRFADPRKDNRTQYRENISSGYTDWKRDNKEPFADSTVIYEQYSDQRGGPYGDRVQDSAGYADWRKVRHEEPENDTRSSDRYSDRRKDDLLQKRDQWTEPKDPATRPTLDQRTARSTGIPDDYSRYNPDVPTSAVRGSESPRGGYDWKQDNLATNVRRSLDSSSYLSSATPARDSALYSASGRGYSADYKSGIPDVNWGMNKSVTNAYFGR